MRGKSLRPRASQPASRNELRELMRSFLEEGDRSELFDWNSFTTANGLPHNWIYDIFQDSGGRIWVGTWGGGLARYDGTTWSVFTSSDGLASDAVTCIREDCQGRIWAATDAGLNRLEGRTFVDVGLYGKSILNIHFDRKGDLWAGCWRAAMSGGGLHKFDGTRWLAFSKRDGLPGLEILKVFEDSRGNIWVGTYERGHGAGVGCWDGRKWRTFSRRDGLISDCVYSMFEDPDGRMWFGTIKGASVYDGKNWYRVTTVDGLVNDHVYTMFIDSKKKMWFGTEGGVSSFDGTTWTSFTRADGLVENLVRAILEDRDGGMWFGTYPYAAGKGGISVARNTASPQSISDKALRYLPKGLARELL